jgi:hypothetical protein
LSPPSSLIQCQHLWPNKEPTSKVVHHNDAPLVILDLKKYKAVWKILERDEQPSFFRKGH